MQAALHIKDAIGHEVLPPNKKKVLKIKEIMESDIYKRFKDKLEEEDNDLIAEQIKEAIKNHKRQIQKAQKIKEN